MILVISPETPLPALPLLATRPDFLDEAAELIELLRPKSPAKVSALIARGAMCRYAADRRIEDVAELRRFDSEGYTFAPDASDDDAWVFRRR
ncbi:MAG: peroxide stress protein YaaA [Azoarcus sp.]|jgi:cytoplasmic iron level regulating protein YaaA (DUF328/UPF0246 family)|nr:peroxide stress protein YaaA [Azoarcus sp.]